MQYFQNNFLFFFKCTKNKLLKKYNCKNNKIKNNNERYTLEMMINKFNGKKFTFSRVNLLNIKLAQYIMFLKNTAL